MHNASEMAGNSSHLCVLPRRGRGPDGEKGHDVEGCKRQLMSAARPFEITAETRHRGNTGDISRCGDGSGAMALSFAGGIRRQ